MADSVLAKAMRAPEIRESNRTMVLNRLRDSRGLTRSELSDRTSLTSQALGPILSDLIDDGLVVDRTEPTGGPGRPAARYSIIPTAVLSALLIQRSTDAEVYVANALGDLSAYRRIRMGRYNHAESYVEALALELDTVLDEGELDRDHLTRVTFAVDGAIDITRQVIHDSAAWVEHEVAIADLLLPLLSRNIGLTVTSSAQANALAALAKIDSESDELVAVVQLSFGTWMFLAQNGQLLHGRHGRTGYVSHIPVPGNDRPCQCGRIGCFATLLGHMALARSYQERTGNEVASGREVLMKVAEGDEDALETTVAAGEWLVKGLEPLIRMVDPDRLVVTGSGADDGLLGARLEGLFRRGLGPDLSDLRIDVVSPDLSRLLAG